MHSEVPSCANWAEKGTLYTNFCEKWEGARGPCAPDSYGLDMNHFDSSGTHYRSQYSILYTLLCALDKTTTFGLHIPLYLLHLGVAPAIF